MGYYQEKKGNIQKIPAMILSKDNGFSQTDHKPINQ